MKVSGFIGSPRKKGNTSILVDTFLEGSASAGAETKRFFLDQHEINQCRGCYRNCILKPGYKCAVYRDDMDMILEEMTSSDLMIFASPYYCGSYTAIMARFFERCIPLWQVEIAGEMGTMEAFKFVGDPPLKGKKAVIGLVQDFKDPSTAKRGIEIFEENIGKTYMMDIVEKLHITDVRDVGDISKKTDIIENIYSIGKKLAAV